MDYFIFWPANLLSETCNCTEERLDLIIQQGWTRNHVVPFFHQSLRRGTKEWVSTVSRNRTSPQAWVLPSFTLQFHLLLCNYKEVEPLELIISLQSSVSVSWKGNGTAFTALKLPALFICSFSNLIKPRPFHVRLISPFLIGSVKGCS